ALSALALLSRMPRSITAWLMASVSVTCSAIKPSQMNTRLIARNIVVSFAWLLGFLFQQDLLLEDESQLLVELFLVDGANDVHAHLLERSEHLGFDVERDEMHEDCTLAALRALLHPRNHHFGIRPYGVAAVRD